MFKGVSSGYDRLEAYKAKVRAYAGTGSAPDYTAHVSGRPPNQCITRTPGAVWAGRPGEGVYPGRTVIPSVLCSGNIHRDKADQDRERDNTLTTAGWHILRFSGRRILRDSGHCLETVKRTVRRLGGVSSRERRV